MGTTSRTVTAMVEGSRLRIRPAEQMPRLGRSWRIDHDLEVGDWDYAEEGFLPSELRPEPVPDGLVWAHRVDHAQPAPSGEQALDFVLRSWKLKGHRPFPINPMSWL
jgi:hypothetical protein